MTNLLREIQWEQRGRFCDLDDTFCLRIHHGDWRECQANITFLAGLGYI